MGKNYVDIENDQGATLRYRKHANGRGLVAHGAKVHPKAHIEAGAYIEPGARIGAGATIARGYAYKEVATALFISIKTVETHVSSVLRKLQLSSRHELTAWASERRLL